LLIGITLLSLVFAPFLPELTRADRIARQVKIIEEMGGQCVFVDRKQNFFAGLMQRWWPVKIPHIEHNLLMAEFNELTVDLARLQQTPDIRGACFNECLFVLPASQPDVRLPRIEYVQLQERDDAKGDRPDPAIMRRFPAFFPNLRKAQLMGISQRQPFIDSLADCEQLEDLDLWFRTGDDESVNTDCLQQLTHLRRLRLSGVTGPWDWSFLGLLVSLEEAELGSVLQRVGTEHPAANVLSRQIFSPSAALANTRRLKNLSLYEVGEAKEELKVIADSNELETIRLPDRVQTIDALEAVKNESRLRKITNVRVSGNGYEVFRLLKGFPELRELEVYFSELTDHDLRALTELNTLERIVFEFDPHRGGISAAGIELFRKLPIKELDSHSYLYHPLPMAEGMQRLVDSWPGPGPGMAQRQTDEGVQFLLRDLKK